MRVTQIELYNFRNYIHAGLSPDPRLTVLTGPNAQGKTNVLEALHLCCLGRSHRTVHDRELITWGQERGWAKVAIHRRDGTQQVGVALHRAEARRKQVQVNGKQVARIGELMGHFHGILFSPEDLSIVKDGPGERRRFLDMELSQLRPVVFYALQRYARALGQRNNLLRELHRNPALRVTLDTWDEQLAEAGAALVVHRRSYIEALSAQAQRNYAAIAGESDPLTVRYHTQIGGDGDAPALAGQFLARLRKAREDDIRRSATSVGPHRDDLRLLLGDREARVYGSQGQQRTVVLSLKLAELDVVRAERGENPVLLLDDVMSELDPYRRRQLVERIAGVQTIVTCTDPSDLGGAEPGAVYRVQAGTLTAL
ncbi:MAG: DNA replication/repair protein RecF [Clostridia bacterium]|nr:DNA replication/repair protein RecF [Clostridia bacterium]